MDPIAHDATISTNGNYLYSTDERGGLNTAEDHPERQLAAYLKTWDISNINATPDANGFRYPIKKVYEVKEASAAGSFANSYFSDLVSGEFSNSIHNVLIRNESGSDIAYSSYYTKGLRILNVANPLSPTELGWYDTPGAPGFIHPIYNGSWGVYPYFNSGTILVSDVSGLFVFRRATEVSGTISSNTTWSGAIFVTNSITVNNNATLTIPPGTTVAFADGKSLTVTSGAKIIADGTPTQTIKFTSNSHPPGRAKWGFITLYSTGNVFDHCTVEYGNQSLKILNGGATISNCTFQHNDQAVRMEYSNTYVSNSVLTNNRHAFVLIGQSGNGNSATIYNCHAKDNDRDGVFASGYANGVILGSHLENNGKGHINSYHGVYAYNNCNLTFYVYDVLPSSGLNTIRNNEGAGVYSSNSTINIGIGSSPSSRQGDNAIFGNGLWSGTYNGKQIYNAAGATVNARYTYWGAGNCPPPTSLFSGNVDYANCLSTSPTGFSKVFAGGDSSMMQDTKSVVAQLKGYLRGERGAPPGFEDLSVYDALALYFSLIRNDFQDAMQERFEVESVLREVYEENKGDALADKAFQFLIGYKMIYVDWAEAEALCEQALTELSQAVQPDLLATLISLELRLGKFGEASQHFETYVSTYPQEEAEIQSLRESFVTAESDYELGWKRGLPKPGVSSPETSAALATVPATFGLAQNFPNPFNPETTIRFSLGEREHVRLVIFDIAGQRVCTLYEGELAAGAQTLTWNGRNQNGMAVASGVYLYELSVGDRVERKKMMLVR